MVKSNYGRRDFLLQTSLAALALPLLASCDSKILAQTRAPKALEIMRRNSKPPADCGNWCGGAIEAPDDVTWETVLADEKDAGEPLLVSGIVYAPDGKTPAPDILIYVYHTDAKGFYGRGKNDHPHGRHHGWMLTDARGRYRFRTIKPAPYPNGDTPAHIHYTLTGVEFKEDWIDGAWFEGDKLLTAEFLRKQDNGRGGFDPILHLRKGANGVFHGTRDIRMWKQ